MHRLLRSMAAAMHNEEEEEILQEGCLWKEKKFSRRQGFKVKASMTASNQEVPDYSEWKHLFPGLRGGFAK